MPDHHHHGIDDDDNPLALAATKIAAAIDELRTALQAQHARDITPSGPFRLSRPQDDDGAYKLDLTITPDAAHNQFRVSLDAVFTARPLSAASAASAASATSAASAPATATPTSSSPPPAKRPLDLLHHDPSTKRHRSDIPLSPNHTPLSSGADSDDPSAHPTTDSSPTSAISTLIRHEAELLSSQIKWVEDCRRVADDACHKREELWRVSSAGFHDRQRQEREEFQNKLLSESSMHTQTLNQILNEVKAIGLYAQNMKWETPSSHLHYPPPSFPTLPPQAPPSASPASTLARGQGRGRGAPPQQSDLPVHQFKWPNQG